MIDPTVPPGATPSPRPTEVASTATEEALREAARAFEAAFLSEMLKHTGLSKAPDEFGGGVGEEQFAGFLREAQAKDMVASGGIGLAEHIFRAMQERMTSDVDN